MFPFETYRILSISYNCCRKAQLIVEFAAFFLGGYGQAMGYRAVTIRLL
ncbi:hypothetical protein DSUL_50051 [Desulfovibrionales bacterium]